MERKIELYLIDKYSLRKAAVNRGEAEALLHVNRQIHDENPDIRTGDYEIDMCMEDTNGEEREFIFSDAYAEVKHVELPKGVEN